MAASKRWKFAISSLLVLIVATACQLTGSYSIDTQQTFPNAAEFEDINEYRVRAALFLIPRGCVTSRYFGGDKSNSDPSQKVRGTFRVVHLRENAGKSKNWYEVRGTINQIFTEFYVNAENPREFTCSKEGFRTRFIENGKADWTPGHIVLTEEQIQTMIQGNKS